jgi:probable rRNA maturation factor
VRLEGAGVLVDSGEFAEVPVRLLEHAVLRTLAVEGRSGLEMSLALLGDDEMRELNRRYLGRDRLTDVIAFALGDGEELVGDVYIGVEQARRQAADMGVSFSEELARLAIHGTLHVLGHDHPEGDERERSPMFRLQERLLRDVLAEMPQL